MKHISGLIFLIGLVACTDSSVNLNPQSRIEKQVEPAGSYTDQNIQFQFMRHAAYGAILMSQDDLASAPQEIREFYQKIRVNWIEQLQKLSKRFDMYKAVEHLYLPLDSSPAAGVFPDINPQLVVLNYNYLTHESPLDDRRGIALAIHEAGHFALPYITPKEHKMIDLVAVFLLRNWKIHQQNIPYSEIVLDFDASELVLSRDGRVLSTNDGRLWFDLHSGVRFKNSGSFVQQLTRDHTLQGPAVRYDSSPFYLVHNVTTGQRYEFYPLSPPEQIGYDSKAHRMNFLSEGKVTYVDNLDLVNTQMSEYMFRPRDIFEKWGGITLHQPVTWEKGVVVDDANLELLEEGNELKIRDRSTGEILWEKKANTRFSRAFRTDIGVVLLIVDSQRTLKVERILP